MPTDPQLNIRNSTLSKSKAAFRVTSPSGFNNISDQVYQGSRTQEAVVQETLRDSFGRWNGWVKVLLPQAGENRILLAAYPMQSGMGSKSIAPPTPGMLGLVEQIGTYYAFKPYPIMEINDDTANTVLQAPVIADGEHYKSSGSGASKAGVWWLKNSGTHCRKNIPLDVVEYLGTPPANSGEQTTLAGEDLALLRRVQDKYRELITLQGNCTESLRGNKDVTANGESITLKDTLTILAQTLDLVLKTQLHLHTVAVALEVTGNASAVIGGDTAQTVNGVSTEIVKGNKTVDAQTLLEVTTPEARIKGDVVQLGSGSQEQVILACHKYRTFCPVLGKTVGEDPLSLFPQGSPTVSASN